MSTESRQLAVHMLGSPRIRYMGQDLEVASRKSVLLLCLLAIRETPLGRQEAAELLWQGGGLGNVRQAVYQLRQLPGADEWLNAGDELSIKADTDLSELETAVQAGDYAAANALWRGPLLAGVDYGDSAELQGLFDEVAQRAESLHKQALAGHAGQLEEAGDLGQALANIEKLLQLDPFSEATLRQALRLEFLLGRAAAAVQRFENWKRLLHNELDAEPLEETVRLAEMIGQGKLPPELGQRAFPLKQRHLLGAIQAGGGRLGIDQLAAVLRRDAFEVSRDLEELKQQGIISGPADSSGAAVVALSASDAQLLAGRIASVLEEEQPEQWQEQYQLARHWLQAGEGGKAAGWFLKAAGGAFAAGALEQAGECSFRAAWAGTERERYQAMVSLESVAERRGDESLQTAALDEADSLAWKLQDDAALCRVRLMRARSMVRRRQNSLALQHAEEAMEIARRTNEPPLLALAFNGMGMVRFSMGELSAALEAFRASAEQDVPSEAMRALSNMGAIHGMREQHDEAYALFDRALTMARSAGDLTTVSACLNNLSASAERLGAYDKALRHLHEARQLAKRLGHKPIETQQIQNMSVLYMRQGSFGPAWNTSIEVIEEGERVGDLALRAQGLEQASDVARHCGDVAQHLSLQNRAGELLEQLGDQRRLLLHRATLTLRRRNVRSIPREVVALKESGLTSLYNWLVLEHAQLTHDRKLGLSWLDEGGWQGPHQLFVADLARFRLLLLGPEAGDADELADLTTGIALNLATSEFAEAPFACHLLGLAATVQGADPEPWFRQRDEILTEQGRGLPAALRESLKQLPARWPESVGGGGVRPGNP